MFKFSKSYNYKIIWNYLRWYHIVAVVFVNRRRMKIEDLLKSIIPISFCKSWIFCRPFWDLNPGSAYLIWMKSARMLGKFSKYEMSKIETSTDFGVCVYVKRKSNILLLLLKGIFAENFLHINLFKLLNGMCMIYQCIFRHLFGIESK